LTKFSELGGFSYAASLVQAARAQPISGARLLMRANAKPGKIDRVVSTLGRAIANGDYDVGSVLPREQDLEVRLNAGRGVVREAVKILATKGLVTVGPRHGTRIQARQNWNYLDREVLAWLGGSQQDHSLLLALEETRRIIEPAAAALAAERATAAERQTIMDAYATMEKYSDDLAVATQADRVFHLAILDATHNPVLGSFRSGLEAILHTVFAVAMPGLAPNLPNHIAVADAIERRDAHGAYAAMELLLDRTHTFLTERFRIATTDVEAAG
jgi:GntR family transcriptional regulator, galactonate operon transcriptional repressor